MKSIGGYFELECENHKQYHNGGILLNSARNSLRYIIRLHNIKHIYIPKYTCPVVWEAVLDEKCDYTLYEINDEFLPVQKISRDAYIVYNNYFGVCGKQVSYMLQEYPNIILDNAQAFYSKLYAEVGSIYSPRKFFGIPDGGIAVIPHSNLSIKLEQDTNSINIMSHLIKRIEYGAEYAYSDFQQNDMALEHNDVKYMSKLTSKLMGNINYEEIKNKRLKNYNYLYQELGQTINDKLLNDDVPMIYPLFTNDDKLRSKLIKNKIYVASYWPNITDNNNFKNKIIPLPIDQRYNIEDMKHIVSLLKSL